MRERMEWELVPRVREENRSEVEQLAGEILSLDALLEVAPNRMTETQRKRLIDLQGKMERCAESPCEAAATPRLSTRAGWVEQVRQLFEERGVAGRISFDDFLRLMGGQHDCSSCRGRSAYPGVSGIPCQFDLTPLPSILADGQRADQVHFELEPDEMTALASDLNEKIICGAYLESDGLDSKAYLEDAVRFLLFWSALGFGVAPAFVRTRE
ncbi:MAG: hypothetical protein FJ109_06550 [Deltaproteobacteria bacterium]|nr:hypothetical protein [Deltaproteobacteria bacterium]